MSPSHSAVTERFVLAADREKQFQSRFYRAPETREVHGRRVQQVLQRPLQTGRQQLQVAETVVGAQSAQLGVQAVPRLVLGRALHLEHP